MIEPTAKALGFNSRRGEGVNYFLGDGGGAFVWIGLLIVMRRKSVETGELSVQFQDAMSEVGRTRKSDWCSRMY